MFDLHIPLTHSPVRYAKLLSIRYYINIGIFQNLPMFRCTVDRFTKELFWNFKKCRAVSMEAYPYKQMSEKKFFPKVAPSPGSGPLLLAGAVAVQGVGGRGCTGSFICH